ncbi:membrane protein implicated in regulation of membrane protease activity [Microbacterium resistens]|uniref:Membrane protein implicated in regulation of membrane protease activity n=1 Tax=Microbacterium resistens TaxID=156977 RepID=A0ABU1SG73_9MICO|nr:hypothetical protein [Microbacterium resistens]MDR6867862.1 membrane protein implicated in regulation of membrane protease activity [Microbacterium resistens]
MSVTATAGYIIVAICAAGALLLGLVVAPLMAPGNTVAMVVPLAIAVFLGWQAVQMRAKHQRQGQRPEHQ